MCRVVDLKQAVLAKNDSVAHTLRAELAARGTTVVNLLSSPGSGKTALLERELGLARERGVPVAALTADLATENDALRLARSGVPVKQVLTDGLCHLEAAMLGRHLDGWMPEDTRLLFVENVGNLVCPASYDLGESLRVVLASVTEGEDKPLKYPTAFGLAQLVVVTKTDIAQAVEFDEAAFRAHVQQVNPGVEVVLTSARGGEGAGILLDRALAVGDGGPVHIPVMSRQPHTHHHHDHHTGGPAHDHAPGQDHAPGHAPHHVPGAGHGPGHEHGPGHDHDRDHGPGAGTGPGHPGPGSVSRAVHPHSGVVQPR
ncbi:MULTISPECIES: hydrogenase nickel incorporation protein HypB [unclassified Streptomyces]|uniref:hydrogenase nickel incorporation protein HypB n=1 Tax=unclassified Streptomyces TaxID=2593676 RepID=UPI002E131480|nr:MULTISPECIES: hydrogenase nickel incorporation protein HypB [unclassified Streptomyces]WSR22961.1 hydrogenase nickel incorporation protein HypB [Streptomyces sp. NBC_01205]